MSMTNTNGGASAAASLSVSDFEKHRRVNVKVHLEADHDDVPRVHQMLEDGTYIPAEDSDFERTSAAASAFVAKSLAARHGTPLLESQTNTDSNIGATGPLSSSASGADPQWAANAFKNGEGAVYEIGRLIAVIEALRGNAETPEPILQVRRVDRTTTKRRTGAEASIPPSILKEAPAFMSAKQRAFASSGAMLVSCARRARKWVKDNHEFSQAFQYLRTNACGVRRHTASGAPLIDVGDGNFAEVERFAAKERSDPDTMVDVGDPPSAGELPLAKRQLVRISTPPDVFLCVSLGRLENDCNPVAAPVVSSNEDSSSDNLEGVLRRIRLSRISAFRKMTFERMLLEAGEMTDAVDFTTNSISVESGPYDVLRVERTMRRIAPNLDIGSEISEPEPANFRQLQDASLLQIVMLHQSINTIFSPREAVKQGNGVFDRVLVTSCALSLIRALENVLDKIVALLGVRVEWARGGNRAEEARAFVLSDVADGDGPSRSLLVIEPLSTKNNAGHASSSGHVKLTPAFGVIIPAPDDPNARGRAAVLMAQSSSSGSSAPTILFDDVPRSYVCPVHSGGEIMATVTLLLCIRLLDAMEMAARAGEAEVLDVDRQCFMVVVSSPQSGRTLRAKVWPKGTTPGHEVPATTAWLNGKVVEDFPTTSPGRLVAWKKLLKRLVSDKMQRASGQMNGSSSNPNLQTAMMQGVDAASNGLNGFM